MAVAVRIANVMYAESLTMAVDILSVMAMIPRNSDFFRRAMYSCTPTIIKSKITVANMTIYKSINLLRMLHH